MPTGCSSSVLTGPSDELNLQSSVYLMQPQPCRWSYLRRYGVRPVNNDSPGWITGLRRCRAMSRYSSASWVCNQIRRHVTPSMTLQKWMYTGEVAMGSPGRPMAGSAAPGARRGRRVGIRGPCTTLYICLRAILRPSQARETWGKTYGGVITCACLKIPLMQPNPLIIISIGDGPTRPLFLSHSRRFRCWDTKPLKLAQQSQPMSHGTQPDTMSWCVHVTNPHRMMSPPNTWFRRRSSGSTAPHAALLS